MAEVEVGGMSGQASRLHGSTEQHPAKLFLAQMYHWYPEEHSVYGIGAGAAAAKPIAAHARIMLDREGMILVSIPIRGEEL